LRNRPDICGNLSRLVYGRVHLSEYFNGKNAEDLSMAGEDRYRDNNIILHPGDPIRQTDRERKEVTSLNGKVESYDVLVLAAGPVAMAPSIHGVDNYPL